MLIGTSQDNGVYIPHLERWTVEMAQDDDEYTNQHDRYARGTG